MTMGLQERYRKTVVPALMKSLGVTNPMRVPRLIKVSVNMGFNATVDKDSIKAITEDLSRITGQLPVITKARKSISNFKLRQGMPVGAKVTMRGGRMFDFLERLIHATLPRIRDFRGLPVTGFDGRGSYTFGLREQTIFPEIDPDSVKRVQGMDITIVTTAEEDREARELLAQLGLPFAKAERS
jgi:large subunit ribosomal protein L5